MEKTKSKLIDFKSGCSEIGGIFSEIPEVNVKSCTKGSMSFNWDSKLNDVFLSGPDGFAVFQKPTFKISESGFLAANEANAFMILRRKKLTLSKEEANKPFEWPAGTF